MSSYYVVHKVLALIIKLTGRVNVISNIWVWCIQIRRTLLFTLRYLCLKRLLRHFQLERGLCFPISTIQIADGSKQVSLKRFGNLISRIGHLFLETAIDDYYHNVIIMWLYFNICCYFIWWCDISHWNINT